MAGFNASVDRYRELLSGVGRGRLPALPNENFDLGEATKAGKYKLTDAAYAKLLHKLEGHYPEMPRELRSDILAFYRDLSLPIATKANAGDWARLQEELEHLEVVDRDLTPAKANVATNVGALLANNTAQPMIRIPIKELVPIVKLTLWNWQQDRAPRMGAALAYYMALSLAPMVVIILAVTGLAFGAKAAQGRLVGQIQGLVGKEGAVVIQSMIEGAHRSSSGIVATVFGLATLFFGGTAMVSELRDALNTIWRVPEDTVSSRTRSFFNLVKERLLSFALVLGAGVFLLLSLIVNTWVSAAGTYLRWLVAPPLRLIQTVDWVISFVLITALFAFIFKAFPSVRLEWSDVAAGAVAHVASVHGRKAFVRRLSRQGGICGHLWTGGLARGLARLGLLLGAGGVLRRGIHPSLHAPLRLHVGR